MANCVRSKWALAKMLMSCTAQILENIIIEKWQEYELPLAISFIVFTKHSTAFTDLIYGFPQNMVKNKALVPCGDWCQTRLHPFFHAGTGMLRGWT